MRISPIGGNRWRILKIPPLSKSSDETLELAILAHDHPAIPDGYHSTALGVILNLEVDDVDAAFRRLVVEGVLDPVLSLRDEDFGQRHFIVAAPEDVLLDVIQQIPPAAAFVDAYQSEEQPRVSATRE